MKAIPGARQLGDIISFARFRFNVSTSAILRQEKEILEPQLIDLGYTDFVWEMLEQDSFGPLSRLCHATNREGERVTFFYG